MCLRDDFENLSKQIDDLEALEKSTSDQKWELVEKRQVVFLELIKKEKLLSKTKWECVGGSTTDKSLQLEAHVNDLHPDVIQMLRRNYHCSCELTDGVSLYFDDSEVSITCHSYNSARLVAFLTEYEIRPDVSQLQFRLRKLQSEAESVEAALKYIKEMAP